MNAIVHVSKTGKALAGVMLNSLILSVNSTLFVTTILGTPLSAALRTRATIQGCNVPDPSKCSAIDLSNNRVKFAKFSVDRHSNLQLEADFVFPMAVTDVEEQLRNLLQLWRLALLELKALVQTLAPA